MSSRDLWVAVVGFCVGLFILLWSTTIPMPAPRVPRARAADIQLLFLQVERLEERVRWLEMSSIRVEDRDDWEAGEPDESE